MDLDNIIVPDDISVQSNEERIVIDPITRVINIPEDYIIGVESDEKSDRMYFQCPKIVGDNVDLSKLRLYVNFENANKERDNYFVDDVTVNEGNILFSWLFSRKVTKYKGDVKFIVCAKKSEDNLILEWNTTVAKGLSLEGIEVELSDEEQSIASDYLIQLEKELSSLAESENNRLLTTSSNQITNITNKGSEQVQLVENTAKKALDSISSTYTDLQKQVNEVEDRELKDANGITQELTITDGYAQLTDTATKRLNSLVIKGNSYQLNTSGKNLFDISKINSESNSSSSGTINSISNGVINGQWKTSYSSATIGSNEYSSGWFNTSNNSIELQSNTYTLSLKHKVIKKLTTIDNLRDFSIRVLNKTDNSIITSADFTGDFANFKNITKTFTLSETTDVYLVFTCNNCQIEIKDIQLEVGSTATSYEPYTGGKPSPNPEYPQEIKAVNKLSGAFYSKNLFDFNIIKDSNITRGTAVWTNNSVTITSNASDCYTESYSKKNYIKVKPNTTYTLLFKRDKSVQGSIYIFEKKNYDDSNYYDVSSNTSSDLKKAWTFTTKSSTNYLAFRLGIYQSGQTCTFSEIMLVEGSHTWDNISYENGKQSLLNYTLQNPLYKLGDVYDYIDVNKGKIVRNIGVITFDGSDDEDITLSPPDGSRRVYLYKFRNSILSIENINPYCKSNMFKFTNLWTDGVMSHNHLFYVSSTSIYVSYNEITSLNDFKTWLNKNPITVVYQLATPTEEDIPTELLTQLKQLQTYSGKTNISFEASDVYPTIDLEYIVDTKKYIESKEELDNQSIIDIDYRVTCLELDMEEQ